MNLVNPCISTDVRKCGAVERRPKPQRQAGVRGVAKARPRFRVAELQLTLGDHQESAVRKEKCDERHLQPVDAGMPVRIDVSREQQQAADEDRDKTGSHQAMSTREQLKLGSRRPTPTPPAPLSLR